MRHLIPHLRAGKLVCGYYEMLEMIEGTPQVPGILQKMNSSTRYGQLQQTLDLAYYGWSEGATAAQQHPEYGEVFAQGEVRTTSWGFDSEEGEFSTERLLSGADSFLIKPSFQHRFAAGVRVLIGTSMAWTITEETRKQQAIAIAAGLWQLERRRIPIELWSLRMNVGGWFQAVKVHSSGDTFNLGKLTFACGHPDYLKGLMWALSERTSAEVQKQIGRGYGAPEPMTGESIKRIYLPPWDGDTLIFGNPTTNDVASNQKKVMNGFRRVFARINDNDYVDSGVAVMCDM